MKQATPYKSGNSVFVCCNSTESDKACAPLGTALEEIGSSAKVFPCCWYVITPLDPSEVKAKLSQTLCGKEALLVVDATNHEAAWGNIAANAAELIRGTWASGAVPSLSRRMGPTRALRDGEGVAAASLPGSSATQRMQFKSE